MNHVHGGAGLQALEPFRLLERLHLSLLRIPWLLRRLTFGSSLNTLEPMMSVLGSLVVSFESWPRSRATLQLEFARLAAPASSGESVATAPVSARDGGPVLWAWLSRSWSAWRSTLVIVKPETVIAWHRQMLPPVVDVEESPTAGRPPVPADVRTLIRAMSNANTLWSAPRIHGELLKLGIDVSQATVAR